MARQPREIIRNYFILNDVSSKQRSSGIMLQVKLIFFII